MDKKITLRSITVLVFFLGLVGFAGAAALQDAASNAAAADAAAPSSSLSLSIAGSTTTLLPDGRQLLLGGQDRHGRVQAGGFLKDPATGRLTPLSASMNHARTGHSATVLPDGTVLLLGGIGADGKVVSEAELFDPESLSFHALARGPTARAFHTATLLTDGQLLIAGGVSETGKPLASLELWDFRHKTTTALEVSLARARRNHHATLLADGRVLFAGGKDNSGHEIKQSEVFDPEAKSLSPVENPESLRTAETGMTELRASSPQDGAQDVPVDALISMRFSRLVQMSSINRSTVVLEGPGGTVEAKIVAAESGMLAFITPSSPLEPGTTYSVSFSGAVDSANATVAHALFTFTTAGVAPGAGDGAAESEPWAPTADWHTHRPDSEIASLPSLKAHPGVTALAGRVLSLNGKPLAHVTLSIGKKHVESDNTGRFLLEDVPAGHQVLGIDGSTANRHGVTYGFFEYGAELRPKVTNTLSFNIWMPVLDTAHAVNIPSPTNKEVVVGTPTMPGLELHLEPGTVIYDRNHKVVKQITITPVPLDRTPFPLPFIQVPLYFTIQPGGAYIEVNGSSGVKGARLFYPNSAHLAPGMPFEFWNYNPDQNGWYPYGIGQVNAAGTQVVPDAGVRIYEFSGAMVGDLFGAPPNGPVAGVPLKVNDPVDLTTGLFVYSKTDLVLPDVIPLNLTRTYRPNDSRSRPFGVGATHPYEIFIGGNGLMFSETPYVNLILPDGSKVYFKQSSADKFTYVHTQSGSPWYGAVLSQAPPAPPGGVTLPGIWQLRTRDGTYYSFNDSEHMQSPSCQALVGITDRHGNQIRFNRAWTPPNCDLLSITSQNGRYINFQYDSSHRITTATDNAGRVVNYAYDGSGRLAAVADVAAAGCAAQNMPPDPVTGLPGWVTACPATTYTYNDQGQMLTITDARGIPFLTNEYDSQGHVTKQTNADGGLYQFAWTVNTDLQRPMFSAGSGSGCDQACQSDVFQFRNCPDCKEGFTPLMKNVTVVDPRGRTRYVEFGETGSTIRDIRNQSTPEQQSFIYDYYADNLLKSVTDTLGHVTSFDHYDSIGNPTFVTTMSGTSAAATYQMYYDSSFGSLLSVYGPQDPNQFLAVFYHDYQDNLIATLDPLGHQTRMTYDSQGRLLSVIDAEHLDHASNQPSLQYTYDGPDLAAVTDALGNTTQQFFDGAGRLTASVNPLGETVRYTYNNLNQPTQVTDSLGGVTSFTYDPNGNLLTVQDARQQGTNLKTSYTYDVMDRVSTRTDPLGRQQSYTYDLDSNLTSFTDRNGKVTTFQYDAANRKKFVGFGTTGNPASYESTISYAYDSGNRPTQISDSVSGNISFGYDDINHTFTETTARGSVTHTFDVLGRQTSVNVPGQPLISYQYDNGNRVTQIMQAGSNVSFTYDDDSRPTSMTLPNGITVAYSYDLGSHLTGMTYQQGANTIGTLNYTYDVAGRRTGQSGSLARTGLPPALTAATYDADNQIASWNGTPFTYDNDGNLLNDGTNTYAWNARGQLMGMAGPVNAAFSYDAAGRRTGKLIGSQSTGFAYNGGAITQEFDGNNNVTANIWNGGTSFFQRTDANGRTVPITDVLGSVLALADPEGNLLTQYTYDPYGATTSFGAPSANPFQYIGQENDGLTGLYYLHARYYSPALMRFISEDPIGYAGGDMNFHAYGWKSPTNLRDPNGTDPLDACVIGGVTNAIFEAWRNVFAGRKNNDPMVWLENFWSGCKTGVLMELLGVNWLFGKVIGWAVKVGVDIIGDIGARVLEDELADAAAEACGICFPAGTPIHTKHGLVPIEKIKKGDEVLSRNHATGKLQYERVTGVVKPHQDRLMQISVAGQANVINPTPTHPFFVKHAGQKEGGWAEASVLKIGDEILNKEETWTKVTDVSDVQKEATVYNFEVAGNHDYFVGPLGLLVHNGVCFSGHGTFRPADGTFIMPEGTSVSVYTETGKTISDALGNAIETGGDITAVGDSLTGARTYLPGSKVPNLVLHPPDGLVIKGNPITVSKPTFLRDLLEPNMGNCQWAACLYTPKE
jgi:RHS repeat-associated protein